MLQEINITEARNKIGEIVDTVRYRGDTVVLVKSRKRAAAIVPIERLERYAKDRAAAVQLVAEVREQNKDTFESEAELQAFIAESVQAVRRRADTRVPVAVA